MKIIESDFQELPRPSRYSRKAMFATLLFAFLSLVFATGAIKTDTVQGDDDFDYITYALCAVFASINAWKIIRPKRNPFFFLFTLLFETVIIWFLVPGFFALFGGLYCQHWHKHTLFSCHQCAIRYHVPQAEIGHYCGG